MEDYKEKALEKIRQRAMDWHSDKAEDKEGDKVFSAPEAKSAEAELGLVLELKKIIQQSTIERKEVLLAALQAQENMLVEGRIPEKLPYLVKNILNKKEITDRVTDAAKRYRIAGESLYYLWGLEDG